MTILSSLESVHRSGVTDVNELLPFRTPKTQYWIFTLYSNIIWNRLSFVSLQVHLSLVNIRKGSEWVRPEVKGEQEVYEDQQTSRTE